MVQLRESEKRHCQENQIINGIFLTSIYWSEKIKPLILLSKGCIKSFSSDAGNSKKWISISHHLMDEILHADDAKLAQGALDQVVGGDGGAVANNLSRKINQKLISLLSELLHF